MEMKKVAHHQCSPSPWAAALWSTFPRCHMVWNILLVSWISFLGCFYSQILVHPHLFAVGELWEVEEALTLSADQQQPRHLRVINTVSNTNPSHSPILATMEKNYFTPAKTSTLLLWYFPLSPFPFLGMKKTIWHFSLRFDAVKY